MFSCIEPKGMKRSVQKNGRGNTMNLYHYPKRLLQQRHLIHEENETKAYTVYSIGFL